MDTSTAGLDEQLRREQEHWTEELRKARSENRPTGIITRNLDKIRAQRDQLLDQLLQGSA